VSITPDADRASASSGPFEENTICCRPSRTRTVISGSPPENDGRREWSNSSGSSGAGAPEKRSSSARRARASTAPPRKERNPLRAGDLDEQGAGDALQHPERKRRGHEHAALDEEDVGGGPFRHPPREIQQDGVVSPRLLRLAQGEDVVQVVAGLERRVERLGR